MKKFIMALVCLMTMVAFTSCSKDDDTIETSSLHGKWLTTDNIVWSFRGNTISIYPKNDSNNKVNYSYELEDNVIVIHMKVKVGGGDAEYYKRKLNDLQEQLKTSRGSYRQYLIDEINKITNEYHEAKKNQRVENVDAYGTILQLDARTLVIQFNMNNISFRKI